MASRKQRQKRPHPARDAPDAPPRFNRRRWFRLVALAVGIAIAISTVAVLLRHQDDETTRLRAIIQQRAEAAEPNIAELIQEAGEVSELLLRTFPENPDVLSMVAAFYERLGQSEDAVRVWETCVELAPATAGAAHRAMANIAAKKGDTDQAVHHYRAALTLDPGAWTAAVRLGEVLIDQGQLEEAVSLLEDTLTRRPVCMPASVLLGQAYVQLRDYQKARDHLEDAVRNEPDHTNAYYSLATACARLGDQESSKKYRARFTELQQKEEQKHRAELKTSDDVKVFRQTVANAHTWAGQILIGTGDLQTGEDHLLRAAELDPAAADCRDLLAWLYETQGRKEDALAMLKEIRRQATDDLAAQLRLGQTYVRMQRFEDAAGVYQRAIELSPSQGGGYALLADLYLQWGQKLEEAQQLAEKAVELEPLARHYFVLSKTCLKTNDQEGALRAVNQAVALDGSVLRYRELQQKLREKK